MTAVIECRHGEVRLEICWFRIVRGPTLERDLMFAAYQVQYLAILCNGV